MNKIGVRKPAQYLSPAAWSSWPGLKLKYRITVDPPLGGKATGNGQEILVEFAGPDSSLLLERGAELLRAMELLAMEMLHLPGNEHEKINFDCMGHRKAAARRIAIVRERCCRKSPAQCGVPCRVRQVCSRASTALFTWRCAMNKTCAPKAPEKGLRRSVVLYPKDYKSVPQPEFRGRR